MIVVYNNDNNNDNVDFLLYWDSTLKATASRVYWESRNLTCYCCCMMIVCHGLVWQDFVVFLISIHGVLRLQEFHITAQPYLQWESVLLSSIYEHIKSHVEYLTSFRRVMARDYSSVHSIITRDYDALYEYKYGLYEQCFEWREYQFFIVRWQREYWESKDLACYCWSIMSVCHWLVWWDFVVFSMSIHWVQKV